MTQTKDSIKCFKNNIFISGQQSLESDIILPDYYGNVNKILRCTLKPCCENVSANGDKFSICGIAVLSVLFVGEDNRLNNFETELKFTKILQCDEAEEYDSVYVEQSVLSCNCRATAPKKIDFKGMLQITVKASGIKNYEIICNVDDDSIITRRKNIEFFRPSFSGIRNINCKGKLNFDSNKENVTVLRKDGAIKFTEIKCVKDKSYIRGRVSVNILYCNGENEIQNTYGELEISEVLDTYGSVENDLCYIEAYEIKVDATQLEGQNENNCFDINCDITISLKCGNNEEIQLIDDAYSLTGNSEMNFSEIELVKNYIQSEKIIEAQCDTEEIKDSQLIFSDIYFDDIKATVNRSENNNENIVYISANANLLIKKSDNNYFTITKSITASDILTGENTDEICLAGIEIVNKNALQLHDGKIRLCVTFAINVISKYVCKVKCLSDVEASEKRNDQNNEEIVMYFASENESLWDIAKENRIAVDTIKKINNIENDFIAENKMIILSNL